MTHDTRNHEITLALFNQMLNELEDWAITFQEDGMNMHAANSTAHDKIKAEYPTDYDTFQQWLNEDL